MQAKETDREVSNFNNPQNKFDDVLALAYNNCVANIKSHVEVTNNISAVNNVRVAYHSDILSDSFSFESMRLKVGTHHELIKDNIIHTSFRPFAVLRWSTSVTNNSISWHVFL